MKPPVNPSAAGAPRRGYKFPLSLTFAARHLGMSAAQLWRVLNGRAADHHGTKAAYNQLCAAHAANATSTRPRRARLIAAA